MRHAKTNQKKNRAGVLQATARLFERKNTMGNLLNFFTLGKGKVVESSFTVNPAQTTTRPTRCFCGESSCEALNRTAVYEPEQFDERGFCKDCLESFRCWLTSRKIVYLQRSAA
jgi:hypothetical protein